MYVLILYMAFNNHVFEYQNKELPLSNHIQDLQNRELSFSNHISNHPTNYQTFTNHQTGHLPFTNHLSNQQDSNLQFSNHLSNHQNRDITFTNHVTNHSNNDQPCPNNNSYIPSRNIPIPNQIPLSGWQDLHNVQGASEIWGVRRRRDYRESWPGAAGRGGSVRDPGRGTGRGTVKDATGRRKEISISIETSVSEAFPYERNCHAWLLETGLTRNRRI
ncbi:unnamed protein product, partial [Meganyctiphanes norvegica]